MSNLKNQIANPNLKIQNWSLFWGLKDYRSVYLLEELKRWSNETLKQFSFKICLSRENNLDSIPEIDRKYFDIGHVDTIFDKQFSNLVIEQWRNLDFYLCGRREVVESLRLFLLGKNAPVENMHYEKF